MIAMTFPRVPVPDAVAVQIGSQLPPHVLEAERKAATAAYSFGLARGARYEESRQWLLSEIAAANKVLAAYDPRLIVRNGGAS